MCVCAFVCYFTILLQPSFSLIDRIRCDAARDLLPDLVEDLNRDYDLREDMNSSVRNNSSSVAFLSIQIEKLQLRLAERKSEVLLLKNEEVRLDHLTHMKTASEAGLRWRCLTKNLLFRVFSFLYDENSVSPYSAVCSHWNYLFQEMTNHSESIEVFLSNLIEGERKNKIVPSLQERLLLVKQLKSASFSTVVVPIDNLAPVESKVEYHNRDNSCTPTQSSSSRTINAESLSQIDVQGRNRHKSRHSRIIRVPSSSDNNQAADLLQRALSRTRSHSTSSVSSASSLASQSQLKPGVVSTVGKQVRNRTTQSSKQLGPVVPQSEIKVIDERAQLIRSLSSSSSSSASSIPSDCRPGNLENTEKVPVTTPSKDKELLMRVTKKVELLLSPDQVRNDNPSSRTQRLPKADKPQKLGHGKVEQSNTRRVAFEDSITKPYQEPVSPKHSSKKQSHFSSQPSTPVPNRRPTPQQIVSHRQRKRGSSIPITVPEELRGKVVSLKDASKLLPSLTSHPHLLAEQQHQRLQQNQEQSFIAGTQVQINELLNEDNKLDKKRKQVMDFISQAKLRIEQLLKEKHKIKRLLRSWHHAETQLRSQHMPELQDTLREGKSVDVEDREQIGLYHEKHGEQRALQERYRQVNLHLRICNDRLAEFLRRVPANPEVTQQLQLLQHVQSKYMHRKQEETKQNVNTTSSKTEKFEEN